MIIVSLGDVAWDIVLKPREELHWGSDVPGTAEFLPGGSAANFAVWASRLGASVRLLGKIGEDDLGRMMLDHLTSEGIQSGPLLVQGTRTARIGVLISPSGQRAFVMDKSQVLAFSRKDYHERMLEGAGLLFFTGYTIFTSGSLAFIRLLLAEARKRGVPVAFDPASFHLIEGYGPCLLLEEIGRVEYLLLNEEEAGTFLEGAPPDHLRRWGKIVVLKQGARGATLYAEDEIVWEAGYPVQIVDTTGAGDAFDAAFLVEHLTCGDSRRALRRANRLGAAVVGYFGSQPPIKEDRNDD